ncbi:MAG: hypothetical protein HC850_06935 [Rhodomicrobium sp.]|nr:hypothetical protein [Rhodomicrobium sp.]
MAHLEGSTIIYARTRKICGELMEVLEAKGIKAKIYHAGLTKDIRIKAQEDWIQDKTQVIIATNAFGMGIDKPDVRQVIHFGMPPTLESYYQEAGRAGRDRRHGPHAGQVQGRLAIFCNRCSRTAGPCCISRSLRRGPSCRSPRRARSSAWSATRSATRAPPARRRARRGSIRSACSRATSI